MDLSLSTITRQTIEIVNIVRNDDKRNSFVFTPAEPIPTRKLLSNPPRWQQDDPTFSGIRTVANFGWLRRHSANIVHPLIGTAFTIKTWSYGEMRSGGYLDHEHYDPIFIARLDDGRFFAEQWSDPMVLWDSLNRWRNVSGCTVYWQSPVSESIATCAIGGADWKTIPDIIELHRQRKQRERKLAAERQASVKDN